MKKIFLLFAIMSLTLVSCDKFLDIVPKGELIPVTTDDFELLLNDPQMMYASEYNVLNYYSDDAYWPDMLMMVMKTVPVLYKSYTWEKNIYTETEDDPMWTKSYNRIFTYNTILDKIMDSKGGSKSQKEGIRGEALLGRAVDYFYLVSTYGPAYSEANSSTPTVPLMLSNDIAQNLTRNTLKEIYDHITTDLKEAADLLPTQPKISEFRGSKAGAWGMLSRIGLYTRNWEMAAEYASMVLEKHNTLLNYNDYQVVNDKISIGRTNLPRLQGNPEVFYIRQFDYPYSVSGLVWCSPTLQQSYKQGDRRFNLFFTTYFSMMGGDLPWYNYSAFYELCITPTVPELLLTRAEAYARLGGATNIQKALTDLNKLRKNRIEPAYYSDLNSTNGTEVLKWILEERRRELVFGGLRFYDQKRYNVDPELAKDLTRMVEGKTLELPANSPLYVMSIWPKVSNYHPEWFK